MIITPENLSLTLIEDARKEVKNLEDLLLKYKVDYSNQNNQTSEYDNFSIQNKEIKIGCLVEIEYNNGITRKGRIWGINKNRNECQVNKDGQVNFENISINRLKNISIGYYEELERCIWLTQTTLKEYKELLINFESLELVKDNGYHIIEIVKIESGFLCDIIYYLDADTLRSSKFVLPHNTVEIIGFYELIISNSELVAVNISSKTAFELIYRTNNVDALEF